MHSSVDTVVIRVETQDLKYLFLNLLNSFNLNSLLQILERIYLDSKPSSGETYSPFPKSKGTE